MATGMNYVHEDLTLRAPASPYEDWDPPELGGDEIRRLRGRHEWWCDGLHRLPRGYRGITCEGAAEVQAIDEAMVRNAR